MDTSDVCGLSAGFQAVSEGPAFPCGSMYSLETSCEESGKLLCSLWAFPTLMIMLGLRVQPSTSVICFPQSDRADSKTGHKTMEIF